MDMAEAQRQATRPRSAAGTRPAATRSMRPRRQRWRPGSSTTRADLVALQRQAGNAAVAGVVEPEPSTKPPDQDVAAEKVDRAAAEKAFRKGQKHFLRGEFGQAYDFLTQAQELLDLPELGFSRAQCLRRMGGHVEEAIELFQRYLDAQPTGSRAADAAYWIAELTGSGLTGAKPATSTR